MRRFLVSAQRQTCSTLHFSKGNVRKAVKEQYIMQKLPGKEKPVIIPQNTQLIHRHFKQNHHQPHFASQEVLIPEDSISGNPIKAYISSDTAVTFRELTLKVT